MGLKTWYNNQNDRYLAAKAAKNDPEVIVRKAAETMARESETARHKGAPVGAYGLHRFARGLYTYTPSGAFKPITKDIAGASAEFESGASNSSATAGRVIAGAVLAGPAGAIVGGLFRKQKGRVYAYVTFADGDVAIIDAPVKDESRLRLFANGVNAASKHYAAQLE